MMSGFKFNFGIEGDAVDVKAENTEPEIKDVYEELKSTEIYPDDKIIQEIDDMVEKANMFTHGDHEIGFIHSKDALSYLQDVGKDLKIDSVLEAETLHTDLIAGKYEGGMKVWECTYDLAKYICDCESISFQNKTVLDLGCGMGILGIIALMGGAEVHFQDYNEEVLYGATIPNVLLNLPEENRNDIKTKCRFFSGDWGSLETLMNEKPDDFKYDFILTSETIYNVKNYPKIYKLISAHMKPDGQALIAAKSYYFGVGGSTKEFQSFVSEKNSMKCEICWKNEDGISREIIQLTFNNKTS